MNSFFCLSLKIDFSGSRLIHPPLFIRPESVRQGFYLFEETDPLVALPGFPPCLVLREGKGSIQPDSCSVFPFELGVMFYHFRSRTMKHFSFLYLFIICLWIIILWNSLESIVNLSLNYNSELTSEGIKVIKLITNP